MRHCRITVTRKAFHWFTEEEGAWVLSHVEQSRIHTNGNGASRAPPGQNIFFTELCEKFYSKFPYRDPESHPQLIFTPQQQELAMDDEDKLKLRKRLIDKLGKKRRSMNRKARNAGDPTMSDTESSADELAPGAPNLSDDDDDEELVGGVTHTQTIRNTIANANGIPRHNHTNSHNIPRSDAINSEHYNSNLKEDELNDIVRKLIEMGRSCWAQIEEEELRQRQAQLPILLHAILKILGQGTGAEAHITALWHDGQNVKACSASTDRSSSFASSEQARKGRADFFSFVGEQLGPRICTTVTDAQPAAYGDPENQMRPILPPRSDNWLIERYILKQFFGYLWAWQGGHLPVPWDRLELDGRNKKFFLIERTRLPTGVKCLRNPDLWDENETNAWTTGLRSPQTPAGSLFQFRQPRPGVVERGTRTVIHPNSCLVYQPESLLYVRRMAMEKETRESELGRLPPIPMNPYKPLTERQLAEAKTAVVGNKPLEDLLNYLPDYETYGPYQATHDDWNKAAQECGYIKFELPSLTSGIEYLVRATDENGAQLPSEFFDSAHGMHNHRNLGACMKLIHNNNALVHTRTKTYMGGPFGFKWVVLLLVYLFSCSVKLRKRLGPIYDGVYAEWPRRGDAEIDKAIKHVQEMLEKSVKILHQTNGHRVHDRATRSGEVQRGIGEWSERDVMEYVVDTKLDEWTQRNLIVTSGMGRQQTGPKAPQSASSPQKRPSTQSTDPDDDILMEDGDEPRTPPETPRKKFKYGSSDSGDEVELICTSPSSMN